MKVAMYYNNSDVQIEDMPVPEIGPDEILVKVDASGICGSDVLEWYRIKSAPRVLGHEIVATVEKVGANVDRFQLGQRVFVSHHVPCDTCHYCLSGHHSVCHTLHTTNFDPGGFAQFVRVPAINVRVGTFVLPDDITDDLGVFIEPLACVVRGQRQSGMAPGKTVLVLGAGISGLLHIQMARATSAGRIIATDVDSYRMESAGRFGADVVFDARKLTPESLREANDGMLADLVIVCTGAATAVDQAFQCVEGGGTILFFAVPDPDAPVNVPLNQMWRNEVTITTSYAGSPRDIRQAMALLRSGRLELGPMITHRLPLERAQEGFSLVAQAGKSIKVVLLPHE